MWLLTAVGPVLDQRHFTFALEQKRTYTVGRGDMCDISFNSRTVRPVEGRLEVGDWNPQDPSTPPKLVCKLEPKKNGSFPAFKALSQIKGDEGSLLKEDYESDERKDESELEFSGEKGKGVELSAEAWFLPHWAPLQFCYDQMKNDILENTEGNETEEQRTERATQRKKATDYQELFGKYCVSWTTALDPNEDIPDVLVSPELRPGNDCSYAVCYGVPTVTPAWLQMLSDSFVIPDVTNPQYLPPIDPKCGTFRKNPSTWRAVKSNRKLFSGYRVVGVAPRPIVERKWFTAMGADWDDLDVLQPPLSSTDDLMTRLAPNIKAAADSGREMILVYYPSLRGAIAKQNVDPDTLFFNALYINGIGIYGAAPILWGSVAMGSVSGYLATKKTDAPTSTPAAASPATHATTPATSTPATTATPTNSQPLEPAPKPTGKLVRRAPSRSASRAGSRAPSLPPSEPQQDIVPSSFPDDTAAPQTTTAADSGPSTTTAPAPRKPLKRRANRQAPAMDLDEIWNMPPSEPTAQSSLPQPSRVPETVLAPESQSQPRGDTLIPDSMDLDTPATSAETPVGTAPRSRLRRRAGKTQSSLLDDLDSVLFEEEWKKKETQSEMQELYESSKRQVASLSSGPNKRQRTTRGDAAESAPRDMDIDEDDYVAKALRSSRVSKRAAAEPARSSRSTEAIEPVVEESEPEEEEVEEEVEGEVELPKREKASAKKAANPTQDPDATADVTKDEAFLQAIKTARGKKEIDELDKEFNQMRIPKPNGKKAAERYRPDYTVLDDFDSEMRGNFVEVVRADLFRKDVPRTAAPVTDDGRPNFKKFKKKNIVRRQPITMVLAAQNASEEMGEPYWKTEEVSQKQTQLPGYRRGATTQSLEDDDDAPLLPRSKAKRRLLTQIQEDDDDDDMLSLPPATRRRGATPLTQEAAASRARGRSTRASSVASEASTKSVPPPPPKTTQRTRRAPPASRVIEVLDDSDSDGPVFATARSSRSTRRGTAMQPSSTLDYDDEPRSTRATVASGSTRATFGRKLLVDDDDDDTTFMGVQKKRRVG